MSETTSSHPHSDAGEPGPRLGRRDFARMSLALATGIVGSCAARPTAGTPPAVTSAGVRPTSLESFDGDYSTGDFSQWWVQCKGYNGEGSAFPGSYSAGVAETKIVCRMCASNSLNCSGRLSSADGRRKP